MTKFFALAALITATSTTAFGAVSPEKVSACAEFSKASFEDQPRANRVKATLTSINISYALGYSSGDLGKLDKRISAKIDGGKLSLDGLERLALFGCSNDMDEDDAKAAKDALDSILKE